MSSLFQEEFGYNADTQKLLAKNGETLLGAINFFIASVNTLVNKTIEDTLMTVKQYENARWVLPLCCPFYRWLVFSQGFWFLTRETYCPI